MEAVIQNVRLQQSIMSLRKKVASQKKMQKKIEEIRLVYGIKRSAGPIVCDW